MTAATAAANRRFFVPEAIQTSELDCGPAALYALLTGFNIPASYGRLREACQTSVDGTSVDTLEEVAIQLGLDAEQIILPADHLLLDETRALPALVIVRLPTGLTHFVIAWNLMSRWVQVMDPGIGRRWITRTAFLEDLFSHTQRVSFEEWHKWVSAAGFLTPLRKRMLSLRIPSGKAETWIAHAVRDEGWYTIARLDATVRMVSALVKAGGILPGAEATETVARYIEPPRAQHGALLIPSGFWSAIPATHPDDPKPTEMLVTGAVIVRVLRKRKAGEALPDQVAAPPPELIAALQEAPARPDLAVIEALRADGLLTPAVLLFGVGLASLGVIVQAALFQTMLQIAALSPEQSQQFEIFIVIVLFLLGLFLIELPITQIVQRVGRRLESRLRVRFLEKLPRLADSYFSSRLASEMVARAHALRQLHALPEIGINALRLAFQLVFTVLGIIWLEPAGAPLALLATAVFLGTAYLSRPILQERDLRVQGHRGGLARFFLDALRGLVPLKLHGAERTYRREYEGLLVEWTRAASDLAWISNAWQGISTLIFTLFAIWLIYDFVAREGAAPSALLLFFWTLSLPLLATSLIQALQQYPQQRNTVLRILEPLGAPDETSPEFVPPADVETTPVPKPSAPQPVPSTGVAIDMENVSVEASGHTILHGIHWRVRPGEHVAIVGPSGAGKSSLVGVLLGWRTTVTGECLIDGERLDGTRLPRLRRETVWVDPDVRLWNKMVWDNLLYGNTPDAIRDPAQAIRQADLEDVIEGLDEGMETLLGEGGGLVSGGEGQRVRLARGMTRAGVRLVILDEPFRGLDRATRRKLLARAREFWRDATLLCITHDVSETLAFERLVLVQDGKIVLDGQPAQLAADPASRYRQMLDSETQVREGLWEGANWKHWNIAKGILHKSKA